MSKRLKVILAAAVLAVALVVGGVWWYLRDDAPAEVSLDAAVESAADDSSGSSGSAETDGGVEGDWTVDTETGEFDYDSATGTFAGFRVEEELSSIGSTTAVGRTGDVTGSATIEGTTVTAATFEVDLTTVTTNDSRRDDRVQEALETDAFPTATFALTEPIDLGDAASTGEAVSVTAVGDLTIHGVTRPAEVAIEAQLVDGTIVLVGSVDVAFSDYGVEVPSSPVVLSVDDSGVVEMQLLLVRS
jgi:polyisoprenoid-binding protein YceI